jgi:hypothetical protein
MVGRTMLRAILQTSASKVKGSRPNAGINYADYYSSHSCSRCVDKCIATSMANSYLIRCSRAWPSAYLFFYFFLRALHMFLLQLYLQRGYYFVQFIGCPTVTARLKFLWAGEMLNSTIELEYFFRLTSRDEMLFRHDLLLRLRGVGKLVFIFLPALMHLNP